MTQSILKEVKKKKIINYISIALLTCLQSFIITIGISEVIRRIVSSILEGTDVIYLTLIVFVILFFVYLALRLLNMLFAFFYNKYATRKIEQIALAHLCNLDEWQIQYDGLKILAGIRNDIYKISPMQISLLSQKVGIFASLFFGTIYGLRENVYVYLVCIIATVIIYLITKKAYPKLKEYEYQIGNEFNKNYANINEIINNIGMVHLLFPKRILREFQWVSNKNVKLNIGKGKVFAYVYICKKISNVMFVFLTCFFGVVFAGKQENYITVVSKISALAYLLPSISQKILDFIDVRVQKNNMKAIEKRIDSIFDLKKYDENGKKTIQGIDEICVKNVCFSYGNKKVLSDLSFQMKKGILTVFCGVSGCGKSTLLKLLCRVIPVDDNMIFINTNDINSIIRSSIWEKTSYLSQKSHIVKGTIKENILAGEKFDSIKYQEAIYVSTLIDSMKNFRDGSEQLIDENTISSGEKQKIALARAIYKHPDFLCMDEAVSAMDPSSQVLVLIRLIDYVKKHNILCAYVSHVQENYGHLGVEEIKL